VTAPCVDVATWILSGLSATRRMPETAAKLVRIVIPVAKSPSHHQTPMKFGSGKYGFATVNVRYQARATRKMNH